MTSFWLAMCALQAHSALPEGQAGSIALPGGHAVLQGWACLYLPLMLRLRRAARRDGYQMGKVKVPAASAVVFSVTSVSSRDTPRRCQSVTESPLQYCICSAVGAPGKMATYRPSIK